MSDSMLSQAEIDEICDPLTQPAAQIRHLERMGLVVLRKASGRPLVARAEYERVMVRKEIAEPEVSVVSTQPDVAAFMQAVGKGRGNGAQAQGR